MTRDSVMYTELKSVYDVPQGSEDSRKCCISADGTMGFGLLYFLHYETELHFSSSCSFLELRSMEKISRTNHLLWYLIYIEINTFIIYKTYNISHVK